MDKNILRKLLVSLLEEYMLLEKKRWIQKAIKKEGSLRDTARKAGKITSKGTIDTEWLRQQAKKNTKTGRRARLALTLKKLRKK